MLAVAYASVCSPSPYTGSGHPLLAGVVLYCVGWVLGEWLDDTLYRACWQLLIGHTAKHLTVGAACWQLVGALRGRHPKQEAWGRRRTPASSAAAQGGVRPSATVGPSPGAPP